ncbi:MAG: hypothetical protein HDT44_08505 [Ruminococcaceae bacterium]|nr:hypothetical protein [Oscillospiraceae bacterium]
MKNYRLLTAAIALAMLLSGCSNADSSVDAATTTTTSAVSTISADPEPALTTTNKVSAVEDQPEETHAPDITTTAAAVDPGTDKPDEFPTPYPTANIENPELLKTLKEYIEKAETAESILNGKNTLIPLKGDEKNGYKLIDPAYAEDTNALVQRMYSGFAYFYFENTYDMTVRELLETVTEESDDGIMMKYSDSGEFTLIAVDSAVITNTEDDYVYVTALGKRGDKYLWRTYEMGEGEDYWEVRRYTDVFVTGEMAVFDSLLIKTRDTLDKIFGNAQPVKTGGDWNPQLVTIEDDIYGNGFYNGLEIEPFMTVEEMRQYLRDTFTSEIAESYISLYVNRTYVEKEGKLYIISGSILPQMGVFSLDNYKNTSTSTYSLTSTVEWSDGDDVLSLPVTIAYEDGRWKLDTRLPMMRDRVIG